MRLKLFRANTVAAAIAQVRTELGEDALILSTRRIGEGIEVTAAAEPEPVQNGPAPPAPKPPAPAQPAPDQAKLSALKWHGVPDPLAATLAAGPLPLALSVRFRFTAFDLSAGSQPLLVTGPPGGGKTLTVARLATRLVLKGVKPLVISTDAERAGAAEQLAAFTRLLGLPLIAAHDTAVLARALKRRQDGVPVLIDTAGINPFNPAEQAAVAAIVAASKATSVLVLPAGLDPSESADTAAACAAAGATQMVATRVDAARRIGGVLAAAAAGLALTEAGTSARAEDGLQPLTPAFLSGRLAASPNRRAA